MIRKFLRKIRAKIGTRKWYQNDTPKWYQSDTPKWYQSHKTCLFQKREPWKYILEQAQLANEQWYVEQTLVSPARDSLSGLSDGERRI